jgi:hypothetical protein
MQEGGELLHIIPWIIFRAVIIDFTLFRVLQEVLKLLLLANGRLWGLALALHTIISGHLQTPKDSLPL